MTMTVAIAQTHLDAWLAANLAVAQRKSYAIGDRTLTSEDAAEIRQEITIWQRTVASLTSQAAGAGNPGIKLAKWS